jgi:glycosyltransferase involved in cell wall biosynthesis
MCLVSLVVPCFNEEAALPLFYTEADRVTALLPEYDFEFIFVDDGSKDLTLSIIKELTEKDKRVRFLSFSRNFGKEAALYAGLCHAKGDYVTVMDADLQDPPKLLPEMLEIIKSGEYDCVALRRTTRRGEPPVRSFFARRFYKIINAMSNTEIVDGARDFRLMPRQVVEAIVQMPEYNRFTKGIYGWVGFKTYWMTYENVERVGGVTKWSFWKLFLYALNGIVAFSTTPLVLASVSGLIFCLTAVVALIWIIVKTLVWGDPVPGWPALACCIVFIGGIQLFCLGIMGQYISKIYLETKRRPIYILKESGGEGSSK